MKNFSNNNNGCQLVLPKSFHLCLVDLSKFAEVLVVDPVRQTEFYRGGVGLFDNNPVQQSLAANLPGITSYLHYVVHSVLRGEAFLENDVPAGGVPLVLSKLDAIKASGFSYEQDVAPILIERCGECHRKEGMAPWAMDSHRMVQGWSSMILETLLTRRMPPGQIDPQDADRFEDVHHISDREMGILASWIEAGATRDSELPDPLAIVEQDPSSWALGEPDLIVEFPEQRIPATGVLEYSFVPIEI